MARVYRTGSGNTGDSLAGEIALEFMFWPWPERKFGWYLEPTYGYDFGSGHEQSLGMSVGLIVAIPRRSSAGRRITHAAVIPAAIVDAIAATPQSFSRIDVASLSCTRLSGNECRYLVSTRCLLAAAAE